MRISKFTLPALTVAGALALAACGGGGGTTTVVEVDDDDDDPVTLQSATTSINACPTAACVDDVVEGAEDDLTPAQLTTLGATADARKAAIAAGTPLTGLNVSAANQLLDALAGSEALEPYSTHIDTKNAKPTVSVAKGSVPTASAPWVKHTTAGLPGGWEGQGWREPNPAGSSGEEQNMRVWTENPVHISEKYDIFFGSNFADRGIGSAPSTTEGSEGNLTLVALNVLYADADLRNAVPSNFFTSGWTRVIGSGSDPTDATDDAWALRGSFHGVPGQFVCSDASACFTGNAPANDVNVSARVDTANTGTEIIFDPSSNNIDETDVPALFAKKANPDFLSFGVYWTTVLDDDGKVTALRVDPFAGGGEPYTATESIVQSGTGNVTAKYSGSAAGTYVKTIVNDDNDREATGYGGFSADANLTAVFGNSEDTLTGTISDFKLRGDQARAGAAPHSSWEVELEGPIEQGVVKTDSFHAQFQGVPGDKLQSNGHGFAPYGLVGTFEHSFNDPSQPDQYGHVAGAFGAECDGSNCVRND